MAISSNIRKAAERETLTLPFRVPPQETFTIAQLSALCGMKSTFVEEQFDAGKTLAGFEFCGGAGLRHSKRIPRAWAVAFLVRHATWTDESLTDAYVACLAHLPAEALLRIQQTTTRLLAEGSYARPEQSAKP